VAKTTAKQPKKKSRPSASAPGRKPSARPQPTSRKPSAPRARRGEEQQPSEESELNMEQVHELLYQALETEMGGVEIYRAAVESAQNPELKEELEKYLEQTEEHVQRVTEVLEGMGLDPEQQTPGRKVVHTIGQTLVRAILMAREAGDPAAAELVACECVVLAETKDHQNWELLGELVDKLPDAEDSGLAEAQEQTEDEEDEHLYHSQGWCRELWLQSLGCKAVLPPPEEKQDVKTAIGAARAKKSREQEAD
jgi:rubrerythrin